MHKIKQWIENFIHLEAAGGILLLLATVFAMLVANSPWQAFYDVLLDTPVALRIGDYELGKPLLLWINDGLMAIFFFIIGLELKREVLEGQLSDLSLIALPLIAALGGMAVPALIYTFINFDDAASLRGWAIPSATDIAFALTILSLLGSKVPTSLKLFLMTLAIVDDIGAIVIIALFYSTALSTTSLSVAAACLIALYGINR